MKRIIKITAIALVIMLGSSLRNKASAQPYGEMSYQNFYDENIIWPVVFRPQLDEDV